MARYLGRALRVFGLALVIWRGIACAAVSQNSAANNAPLAVTAPNSGPDQELPTVTFVFDHPQVAPNHFEIVVDRAGMGSYVSHSDPKADDAESARMKDEDLQRTF